jgi:hypothetical protein
MTEEGSQIIICIGAGNFDEALKLIRSCRDAATLREVLLRLERMGMDSQLQAQIQELIAAVEERLRYLDRGNDYDW